MSGPADRIRVPEETLERKARPMNADKTVQPIFEALRDAMSPEGLAAMICFLTPAVYANATSEAGAKALREVHWLAGELVKAYGRPAFNDVVDRFGF